MENPHCGRTLNQSTTLLPKTDADIDHFWLVQFAPVVPPSWRVVEQTL
jgi:hypothetical protein